MAKDGRMILGEPSQARMVIEKMHEGCSDYVTHLQNARSFFMDTILKHLELEKAGNGGEVIEHHANLWRLIECDMRTVQWQLEELRKASITLEGFCKQARPVETRDALVQQGGDSTQP